MGFFGPELRVLQGMERTHLILQVVTKWQSLSPQNTKQRLAEILLQKGYYVQALQLDAKCMFASYHEGEILLLSMHTSLKMSLYVFMCMYVCMYVCMCVCIMHQVCVYVIL